MNEQEPVAWMRKWAFEKEEPYKVKNKKGRMVTAFKFLLDEVTLHKCMVDDIPLYANIEKEIKDGN